MLLMAVLSTKLSARLSTKDLPVATSPERWSVLARRVRWLVGATISYNVVEAVEAVVAITAGTIAASTALIGFGLDSVIEVSSAAAVAWQFSAREHAVREAREKVALRVIAVSFFALAAYVTVESSPSSFVGMAKAQGVDIDLPGWILPLNPPPAFSSKTPSAVVPACPYVTDGTTKVASNGAFEPLVIRMVNVVWSPPGLPPDAYLPILPCSTFATSTFRPSS
jgi:hypothetical protein